MDFGDIVGQLIKQGMSSASQGRLQHALGEGGLGELIGSALGGTPANGAGNQAGGLGDVLGSLLGGSQDGMSNAQVGGIGALVGSLLGGGSGAAKGALGGSAMAILGSLALTALKNWQKNQPENGATSQTPSQASQAEISQISAPQTAELCLKGMISAAKADGQIQDDEMQRIAGRLEEGGVTAEERQFVLSEMSKPQDLDGLVREIPNLQVGAQVYAASLLAITVDTESEQAYMRKLAAGLNLNQQTVARLHQLVGASAV